MSTIVISEFNELVKEIEDGVNEKPAEFKTFLDFISPSVNESLRCSDIEELIIEEKKINISEFLSIDKIKF